MTLNELLGETSCTDEQYNGQKNTKHIVTGNLLGYISTIGTKFTTTTISGTL